MIEQQECRERAQHVLGAVREVDDVEHAEDHGEPQAEQRIERAVDQADQQLAEQRVRGDAEDFEHGTKFQMSSRPSTLTAFPRVCHARWCESPDPSITALRGTWVPARAIP